MSSLIGKNPPPQKKIPFFILLSAPVHTNQSAKTALCPKPMLLYCLKMHLLRYVLPVNSKPGSQAYMANCPIPVPLITLSLFMVIDALQHEQSL